MDMYRYGLPRHYLLKCQIFARRIQTMTQMTLSSEMAPARAGLKVFGGFPPPYRQVAVCGSLPPQSKLEFDPFWAIHVVLSPAWNEMDLAD
jgi:hypothetical protein